MRGAVILVIGVALLAGVAVTPVAAADPWVDCVLQGGTVAVPGGTGYGWLECCPKDTYCWPPDSTRLVEDLLA